MHARGVEPVAAGDEALAPSDADVAGLLAELSANEREILLLYAWAELSYAKIAAALGVPVGTVRSRLSPDRAASR
jgi:RNA polymerase sigma factor (sigma-70 family)